MKILLSLLMAVLLFCCSQGSKNVPNATGLSGDIFLVMDSTQWRGSLGDVIDSILSAEMPGLPRKEALFKVRWINPRKLNYVLKQSRNMVFVLTLDQHTEGAQIVRKLFTEESIQQIQSLPSEFITTTQDVFAKGQEIMYLYGVDEQTLIRNLRKSHSRLVDYFNKTEKDRITRTLFRSGAVKGTSEMLNKDFQCDLKIPFGFKMAQREQDFVWLRQINSKDDRNIFITRKAYSSQLDFTKENLIKFRDDVCRKYLFEDPEQPDSYILTETSVPFIPIETDTVNFNGHFAIQLRGLWRTNTLAMGGPFIGFALVDEGNQFFYYIEGFVFSPGKDQREIMRELETILYTFRTSMDLPKQ